MSHRGSIFESFHDLDPLAERIIQTEDVRRLLLEFDELPFRNVNTTHQMSTFSPGCSFWWVNANSIKTVIVKPFL